MKAEFLSQQNVKVSVFGGLSTIYREGGVSALFNGGTARVCWLLPFTVVCLGAYESLKKATLQLKKSSVKSND